MFAASLMSKGKGASVRATLEVVTSIGHRITVNGKEEILISRDRVVIFSRDRVVSSNRDRVGNSRTIRIIVREVVRGTRIQEHRSNLTGYQYLSLQGSRKKFSVAIVSGVDNLDIPRGSVPS